MLISANTRRGDSDPWRRATNVRMGRFDLFARHRAMAAICALRTSGVDVKRSGHCRSRQWTLQLGESGHSRGRLKLRQAHRLAVFSTIKLLGQRQQPCALGELVRDCRIKSELGDHARPKARFELQPLSNDWLCFLHASS